MNLVGPLVPNRSIAVKDQNGPYAKDLCAGEIEMAAPKQTDPQFKLRLPSELKDRLEKAAALNKRSISAEILARIGAYDSLVKEREVLSLRLAMEKREVGHLQDRLRTAEKTIEASLFRQHGERTDYENRISQLESQLALFEPADDERYDGPADDLLDEVSKTISDATSKAVDDAIKKLQKRGLIPQQPPEVEEALAKAHRKKK